MYSASTWPALSDPFQGGVINQPGGYHAMAFQHANGNLQPHPQGAIVSPSAFADQRFADHPNMNALPTNIQVNAQRINIIPQSQSEMNALAWAQRNGFQDQQTENLFEILRMVDENGRRLDIPLAEITLGPEIDKGSFGSICMANHKGQNVVVKRVSKGSGVHGGLAQTVRNVLLELLVHSALRHPAIVDFHGTLLRFPPPNEKEEGFELGIVLDFCDRGNLHSLLFKSKAGPPRVEERMRMGAEIGEAMAYVHSLSVLHRDLSGRNILLHGPSLHVKVSDFGLARRFSGESYDSTTIAGSPQYMPPEQLGGGLLTPKVDVWALGVILWELLALRPAWAEIQGGGRNGYEPFHRAVVREKRRLPPLDPRCLPVDGEAISALLVRTFETDPAGRPAMAEVAAVCRNYAPNPPLPIAPPALQQSAPAHEAQEERRIDPEEAADKAKRLGFRSTAAFAAAEEQRRLQIQLTAPPPDPSPLPSSDTKSPLHDSAGLRLVTSAEIEAAAAANNSKARNSGGWNEEAEPQLLCDDEFGSVDEPIDLQLQYISLKCSPPSGVAAQAPSFPPKPPSGGGIGASPPGPSAGPRPRQAPVEPPPASAGHRQGADWVQEKLPPPPAMKHPPVQPYDKEPTIAARTATESSSHHDGDCENEARGAARAGENISIQPPQAHVVPTTDGVTDAYMEKAQVLTDSTGFPVDRCLHALDLNMGDLDQACNWLFLNEPPPYDDLPIPPAVTDPVPSLPVPGLPGPRAPPKKISVKKHVDPPQHQKEHPTEHQQQQGKWTGPAGQEGGMSINPIPVYPPQPRPWAPPPVPTPSLAPAPFSGQAEKVVHKLVDGHARTHGTSRPHSPLAAESRPGCRCSIQ